MTTRGTRGVRGDDSQVLPEDDDALSVASYSAAEQHEYLLKLATEGSRGDGDPNVYADIILDHEI